MATETCELRPEERFGFNGRRVRAWCVDADISYEELAKRINTPLGSLKSWIYGQREIDFTKACAIADVFGKDVGELSIIKKAG